MYAGMGIFKRIHSQSCPMDKFKMSLIIHSDRVDAIHHVLGPRVIQLILIVKV